MCQMSPVVSEFSNLSITLFDLKSGFNSVIYTHTHTHTHTHTQTRTLQLIDSFSLGDDSVKILFIFYPGFLNHVSNDSIPYLSLEHMLGIQHSGYAHFGQKFSNIMVYSQTRSKN